MSKQYIGVLLRDVVAEIKMVDAMTGETISVTRLPQKQGGRVFHTFKARAEWIAAMNAEHGPGTAIAG